MERNGSKRGSQRALIGAGACAGLLGLGLVLIAGPGAIAQADEQQPSVRGPLSKEEAFEGKPKEGGRDTYFVRCGTCHNSGLNGAPKIGDKLAWQPRIEQGRETLYKHALEGIRNMPPKGGFPSLKDDQVKSAVDYMVESAGGD